MFADVDYSQPDVRADVLKWGEWLGKEVKLSGMRMDAIKHYSEDFLRTFINHLDETVGRGWFFVGEYWTAEFGILAPYIARMGGRISLFDVQLVYNLSYASKARKIDLRRIFDGTLAKHLPKTAVVRDSCADTSETEANRSHRHLCKIMIPRNVNHSRRPSNHGSSPLPMPSSCSTPTEATHASFTATSTALEVPDPGHLLATASFLN